MLYAAFGPMRAATAPIQSLSMLAPIWAPALFTLVAGTLGEKVGVALLASAPGCQRIGRIGGLFHRTGAPCPKKV